MLFYFNDTIFELHFPYCDCDEPIKNLLKLLGVWFTTMCNIFDWSETI